MDAWGPRRPSCHALATGRCVLSETVPVGQAPRMPGGFLCRQMGKELLGQWRPGPSDQRKEDSPRPGAHRGQQTSPLVGMLTTGRLCACEPGRSFCAFPSLLS